MWFIWVTGASVAVEMAASDQVMQLTTTSRPMRVAILNTHPIQYFAPLYAYLTTHEPDLDLTVLYCSDYSLRGAVDDGFARTVKWDIDLLSGYRHIFLGQAARTRKPAGFWSLIAPELWGELRSGRYDVLWLHGYGYFACWLAFLAARTMRMPVMLRGETHLGLLRAGWRGRARNRFLRAYFRSIQAFLAIGSRNREYYQAMGVAADAIHLVPYAVDNTRFIASARLEPDARAQMRIRLGLRPGVTTVLYASRLVERKHPATLLRAISSLQRAGIDVGLCVIGSGPLDQSLRQESQELGLRDISFVGFLNQQELPRAFSSCEIFVLAAEAEPWGLVVNEVMCAGLPVIVSDEAGCAADLVEHGVNGLCVTAGDSAQLARAIEKLALDSQLRDSMGRASLERIRGWGFAECAEGLRSALCSLQRKPESMSANRSQSIGNPVV